MPAHDTAWGAAHGGRMDKMSHPMLESLPSAACHQHPLPPPMTADTPLAASPLAQPPAVTGAPAPWAGYSVLVVDDEEGMRAFLQRALTARGCTFAAAGSAEEGMALVARQHFDVLILDVSLPGKSGIEWLKELKAPGNPAFAGDVILITAFADMETAIDALRAGAADFILKPFRLDQMVNALRRSFERTRLARENFVLRRELRERADVSDALDGMIGTSAAMRELTALIHRVAPLPSTVLIQGESGVGKEVAARALHNLSPRASGPFVPVNCGAIAADLIESELFGHVRGAFTGAKDNRNGLFYYAHGGTIFLDEIGELPPAAQTKLLRVLEERMVRPVGSERELPVDVRVIAATNQELAAEVNAGRFRADLFYRLEVLTLNIAPLRNRVSDIQLLTEHFLAYYTLQLGLPRLDVTPAVAEALEAYPWPGNVRELKNFVQRSLILGAFPLDTLGGAGHALQRGAAAAAGGAGEQEMALAGDGPVPTLAEVEKRHILAVLERCAGNKSQAARLLEVSRKTLERKCAAWGVWP